MNHLPDYAENGERYNAMVKTHGEEVAEKAYPRATRKVHGVSRVSKWKDDGGPAAMRLEAAKCEPLCSMCHALDPQSNQAPCNAAHPDKVRPEKFETWQEYIKARKNARYNMEKRTFVDKIKRQHRKCANPNCPCDGPSEGRCVPGFEACFDWDHIDPATKLYEISRLVCDTKSFKTAKPLILTELPKVRLLCRNCHITRDDWDPPKPQQNS